MPARSKRQQRLMGQAYAYKTGKKKAKDLNPQYADEIKDIAKSMTKKQLKDFAETDHKGLPQKVKESRIMNFESFNESKYTFEDFTTNDMEMVKELYEEGLTDPKQLSIEMDLPVKTIIQILDTLKGRNEINESVSMDYLEEVYDNGGMSSDAYDMVRIEDEDHIRGFDKAGSKREIKIKVLKYLYRIGAISTDVYSIEMENL